MGKKVRFAGYEMGLPASQWARITIGVALILGGVLGFLPILGFWMVPAGLLVLSIDLPFVRRWRRQLTVWWHSRRGEHLETRARRNARMEAEEGPKGPQSVNERA